MRAAIGDGSKDLRKWLAVLVWLTMGAAPAHGVVHSLDGNARFQVGAPLQYLGGVGGIPLPITSAAPPKGRLLPVAGVAVSQTSGPNPKQLRLPPGALSAPPLPLTLPVFVANPLIFQLRTEVSVRFPATVTSGGLPAGSAVFSAGGRTGGPTETYCAGSGAVPPFGCTSAGNGVINGLMRYTATKSQFGGPGRAQLAGPIEVALRGGSPAPCSFAGGLNPGCIATLAAVTPPPLAAQGAVFGAFAGITRTIPSGHLFVTVSPQGLIVAATPTSAMAPGPPVGVVSYGGPWTTGMLTISVTNNVTGGPVFIFSGSDRRAVNGRGSLSLVSGSISRRTLFGDDPNLGWLNLEIGPPAGAHVPGVGAAGLAALAALTGGLGSVFLRRRPRGLEE